MILKTGPQNPSRITQSFVQWTFTRVSISIYSASSHKQPLGSFVPWFLFPDHNTVDLLG